MCKKNSTLVVHKKFPRVAFGGLSLTNGEHGKICRLNRSREVERVCVIVIQLTVFVLFRIRFGSNNLYLFRHPLVAEEAHRQHKDITLFTYEDAQEEIARNSGLDFSNSNG